MKTVTSASCATLFFLVLTASADAAPVELRAGSAATFVPRADQPCFVGIVERQTRLATRTEGDCVFEDGALRARVFVTSGSGVAKVDVSSEVKVVVAQFEVPASDDAPSTSYVPFHAVVPVSWAGRFFNMTGGLNVGVVDANPLGRSAVASVNSYLRLREGSATDANVAGPLISQERFQGSSHGGINQCLTVPTDAVSAAEALVGCALAVTYSDSGSARAEISGVIRTGQVYNLELVIRGDLVSPFQDTPVEAYTPERIGFDDDRGLTWRQPATLRIGTDPERTVAELRQEVDELRTLLAQLRSDFDGHYHVYLTGKGAGHNNTEAHTPPPLLASGSAAPQPAGTAATPAGSPTGDTPPPSSEGPTASVSAATSGDSGGGGAFGLAELGLLLGSTLLVRRGNRH